MTTIINNPNGETASDSAAGIIIGVIFALILVALFIVYGLPALRNNQSTTTENPSTTNINVTVPVPSATTQVVK